MFVLEEFKEIKGLTKVYKLQVNGSCPFDEFWHLIEQEGNIKAQLKSAMAILERYSLNMVLPREKFKDITPRKEKCNEYEVKTKDLRIYLFRLPSGAIVVLGGKKTSQARDINRFRTLKNQYINSLI